VTAAKTPAQRGRRNRANGAAYEVKTANYLRTWWPDACRAVRNTTPDPGDVDGTSPSLWWSVKNCERELINPWFEEMRVKAAGRIGLLVVRRRGYADPGGWSCWLTLGDFCEIAGGPSPGPQYAGGQLSSELRIVAPLLHAYTNRTIEEAS
jgi:hypothetical protein